MAGHPLKTEAVVLRSMRYGEADRILHLYTPHRGKLGAIAKGVRRSRSRFGGRLEPFFRVELMLHEGRSDLLTVTGAETIERPRAPAGRRGLPRQRRRACDAVTRLFDDGEPAPRRLQPALPRARAARRGRPRPRHGRQPARLPAEAAARRGPRAAARRLRRVRRARAPQRLLGRGRRASSAAPARPAPSRWTRRPTRSWSRRSARRWRRSPRAPERALRQADRAIVETAEHHAGVQLREAWAARVATTGRG